MRDEINDVICIDENYILLLFYYFSYFYCYNDYKGNGGFCKKNNRPRIGFFIGLQGKREMGGSSFCRIAACFLISFLTANERPCIVKTPRTEKSECRAERNDTG